MFDVKVVDYFALDKKKGEIGVEIEAEFEHPCAAVVPSPWRVDLDGSLRGYAYEFVLKNPVSRGTINSALNKLEDCLSDHKILHSIRAGIHIHLNVQDLTIKQVLNFMMCYYLLETALLRTCGENREGNLFCLRNSDAASTTLALERVIEGADFHIAHSNSYRYSALNFQSLFRYGSLEFRSLATEPDLANIRPWIDVLLTLKDASLKVQNPLDLVMDISGDGASYWAQKMLGKHFERMDYPDMEKDIMKNLRMIQVALYSLQEATQGG